MNKKIILIIASMLSLTSFVNLSAQTADMKGAGYAFLGAGVLAEGSNPGLFSIGGGGEAVFSNGLGFRAEVGFLTPFESFGDGLGTLSPGLLFEFSPEKDTSGFVGGGYTLFFRDETANGLHFGGGVRHWFSKSVGIRVEVRDEVLFIGGGDFHQVLGRVSFLFR